MPNPGKPDDGKRNLSLRKFKGVNTCLDRTAIENDEFSYLVNAMPVKDVGLMTIPAAKQNAICTTALTVTFAIQATIYFASNGSACSDISLLSAPDIAAAGTFTSPEAVLWNDGTILIIDTKRGYTKCVGVTLTTLDATKKGLHIEIYAGRVWITNYIVGTHTPPTINYTDAGSFSSFAGSGGSFIVPNGLAHNLTGLVVANNYLYIFSAHTIDIVSDVRVVGGIALFTPTTISTLIGCAYRSTIVLDDSRRLLFIGGVTGNESAGAIYALTGATMQKISQKLDGMINVYSPANADPNAYPNLFLNATASGAFCMVNNVPSAVWLVELITYNDVVTNVFIIFQNNEWTFSTQNNDPTRIYLYMYGQFPDAYAICQQTTTIREDQVFYPSFSYPPVTVATCLNVTIKTKLFDLGDSFADKQVMKLLIDLLSSSTQLLTVSIDTEAGSTSPVVLSAPSTSTGSSIQRFQSDGGGYALQLVQGGMKIGAKYIGLTITFSPGGSKAPVIISNIAMQVILRNSW